MTLAAGARLGPYQVVSLLGAGGMGEVYRARDERLGREVALKVLPGSLTRDEDRLRRFEHEARAAGTLNHPNLLTIFDVGTCDGSPYIVSELLDGTTLRSVLESETLPLRKALDYAVQIARGLAAAHEQGIVHRDLKPDNLFITRDGRAKILDFGLAKLSRPSESRAEETDARTASSPSSPGTVMGTVGYMSPEQVQGLSADQRSDIFSFGAVIFEMLWGGRAFKGATAVETMNAILKEDPPDVSEVARPVPPALERIVRRCLEKKPQERFHSAHDLALALEALSGASVAPAVVAPPRRRGALWGRLAWAIAAMALLGGGLFVGKRGSDERQPLMKLSLVFSPDEAPILADSPVLALSPDGTRLVFAGSAAGGGHRLYLRPLDRFEVAAIPGTEGGLGPFFSPDGRWVGFWAEKKLKKVSLAGGLPQTLCDAESLRGASWGADGQILFSPGGNAALWRVLDTGGKPTQVTSLNSRRGEGTHRWPEILPGGKTAIFTSNVLNGNYDSARIEVLQLGDGQRQVLLEGGSDARYLPSGHLVFLRAGSLFAVPFALDQLAVRGPPVPVLDHVVTHAPAAFANYAVSPSGSLVYVPVDPTKFEPEIVWVDRKGVAQPVTDLPRPCGHMRLSPDGRRLAMGCKPGDSRLPESVYSPESDIWIYNLARNAWDRLSSGGVNWYPVWSNDGRHLAFCSNREGNIDLFWMPVDHSAPAERLATTNAWTCPSAWSPDGRTLILESHNVGTGYDIAALSLDGERRFRFLLQTPAQEGGAQLSPDGRWMAYESDDTGRSEVYVLPYPGLGGRWQVSTAGGSAPIWSRDGRELFFESGGRWAVAGVETRPTFRAGMPKPLFDLTNVGEIDVAPDGARFVVLRSPRIGGAPRPLAVVLGWFDDVTRRMHAGGEK
jgi:eukaryotic-like serine/threonine-protein kinase